MIRYKTIASESICWQAIQITLIRVSCLLPSTPGHPALEYSRDHFQEEIRCWLSYIRLPTAGVCTFQFAFDLHFIPRRFMASKASLSSKNVLCRRSSELMVDFSPSYLLCFHFAHQASCWAPSFLKESIGFAHGEEPPSQGGSHTSAICSSSCCRSVARGSVPRVISPHSKWCLRPLSR